MDASSESIRLQDESLRIRNSIKAGTPDLSLSRFCVRVGRWNRTVGDDPPGPLFKGVVSQANVRVAAQSSAEILHTVMQRRHADTDSSTPIDEAESAFEDVLGTLRSGASHGNRGLIALAFETLVGPVVEAAVTTPARVDPSADPARALETVRAFWLLHRIAATAAAIPALQLRQMDDRGMSSLAGIASRRRTVSMPGLPAEYPIATRIADFAAGERIALTAWSDDATWINRPERPYTALTLNTGEQLRVHFKNVRRVGVTGGCWMFARCKVEEPQAGIHYAVVESEGPTTTADTCWESWLQVEAREYYDINPDSVHLFTANTSHRLDLYSRLAAAEGQI